MDIVHIDINTLGQAYSNAAQECVQVRPEPPGHHLPGYSTDVMQPHHSNSTVGIWQQESAGKNGAPPKKGWYIKYARSWYVLI